MKIPRKFLLILSIILSISFVFFSYLVSKELFTQFDFDTTVKFQDRIPRRVDYPFSTLSILGSAEVSMTIWLLLSIFLLIRKHWWGFISMGLLPLALAMEVFGKVFLHHPGPPFFMYRGVISFEFPSHFIQTEYSYPSGHMTRSAFIITFLIVYFYYKTPLKLQIFIQPFLFGLLIAMFVSRIYLGEHWATDVIGGALIGIAFGIIPALLGTTKKLPKQLTHEII